MFDSSILNGQKKFVSSDPFTEIFITLHTNKESNYVDAENH